MCKAAEICKNSIWFQPTNDLTNSSLILIDIYQEVSLYAPKLKNGQMLCVPISEGDEPECVYFVKDISRNCEVVNYNLAW